MNLPGHPHSLQDISANHLYQNQMNNFFVIVFFKIPSLSQLKNAGLILV